MVPGDAGAEAGGPAAAPSSDSGRGPRHPPPGGEVCSGLEPASPPRPGSRLGGSRGSVGPAARRWRLPALLPPSHPPPPGGLALRGPRDGGGPGPGGSGRATMYPARGPAAASQPRLRPGPVLKGEGRRGRASGGGAGPRRRGRGGGAGLKGEDASLPECGRRVAGRGSGLGAGSLKGSGGRDTPVRD